MRHIYASLDIGSDKIKIAVCELYQNKLNILAVSNTKSRGIKRGLITDFDLASISVKEAFKKVEGMLGFKVNKVIASIPSYLAEYNIVKASVDVESLGVITNKDVMKSLEHAVLTKKLEGREVVTILPIDFKINDNIVIKNPVGLNGNKLSVRAILVSVPKKNAYSVVGLLEKIGIEVVDISTNNIGDLYALKNSEFEKGISSIINIGEDTTNVSLFNQGIILKSIVLSKGSNMIDNEISYHYKLDIKTVKEIKTRFAFASKSVASSKEIVECKNNDGNKIKINQYEVSEIIEDKIKEILNMAKNELNSLTSKRIDYIIITGGMSNIKGFNRVLNDIFKKNVSIGSIKMMGARDNAYSSVIGNIIYFISKLKLKGQNYTMIDDEELENLAVTRSTSDSEFGKIFEYFFNN